MNSNNFYGFDVVLDLDEKPGLIEFNGIEAGFAKIHPLYGDTRLFDEVFGRVASFAEQGRLMYSTYGEFLYPNEWQAYASQHDVPFEWFSTFPAHLNKADSDVSLVVGVKYDYESVSQLDPNILVNQFDVEKMTEDKVLTAKILAGTEVEENVPATYVPHNTKLFGNNGLDEFLARTKNYHTFVYKPISGCGGSGVEFIPREEMIRRAKRASGNVMIQPLIATYPIRSPVTDKEHVACARVVYFNGFIDAFWRLAPEPLNKGLSAKTRVASISAGGYPEIMSERHKEIIADFSELLVPIYEQEIARRKIKSRTDLGKLRAKS